MKDQNTKNDRSTITQCQNVEILRRANSILTKMD